MFELVSAHKTGMKTKFLPTFAVKSWEDKILGALRRCRRKRIKDHAKLENKAFSLVFFCFSASDSRAKHLAKLNYVNFTAVNPAIARVLPAAMRAGSVKAQMCPSNCREFVATRTTAPRGGGDELINQILGRNAEWNLCRSRA
jgi:hypothetical protein